MEYFVMVLGAPISVEVCSCVLAAMLYTIGIQREPTSVIGTLIVWV